MPLCRYVFPSPTAIGGAQSSECCLPSYSLFTKLIRGLYISSMKQSTYEEQCCWNKTNRFWASSDRSKIATREI